MIRKKKMRDAIVQRLLANLFVEEDDDDGDEVAMIFGEREYPVVLQLPEPKQ